MYLPKRNWINKWNKRKRALGRTSLRDIFFFFLMLFALAFSCSPSIFISLYYRIIHAVLFNVQPVTPVFHISFSIFCKLYIISNLFSFVTKVTIENPNCYISMFDPWRDWNVFIKLKAVSPIAENREPLTPLSGWKKIDIRFASFVLIFSRRKILSSAFNRGGWRRRD